jgi:hypothetical protein
LISALVSATFLLGLFNSSPVAYGESRWMTSSKAAQDKDAKATKDRPAKIDSKDSPMRQQLRPSAAGRQLIPAQAQDSSWNRGRSGQGPVASSQLRVARGPTSSPGQRSGWGERLPTLGRVTQPEQRSAWASNSKTTLSQVKQPASSKDRTPSATMERRSGWSSDSKTTLSQVKQPAWSKDRTPSATIERRSGWSSDQRQSATADRTSADSRPGSSARQRTDTTGAAGWRDAVAQRDTQSPIDLCLLNGKLV